MAWIQKRLEFLFRSTKGLILVAIAMIALAAAFFGMLSGPMAEFGVRDFWVQAFGIDLQAAEREGRIIILYHSIAMAVVAIETYLITSMMPMKKRSRSRSTRRSPLAICVLWSLVWLSPILATTGLPRAVHLRPVDGFLCRGSAGGGAVALAGGIPCDRSGLCSYPRGVNLERMAFFVMAAATLISSLFGAIPGAYFGNGFEAFLAEDVIRVPHKTPLELSVIGHLHIMLALIAVACALLVGRWLDFKGPLHKIAMPMMILGSVVLSMGVWMVVPFERIAHIIIYVGSGFVMLAALFLVIFGWRKLIRERLAEQGLKKASFFQGVKALVHDPLKFGSLCRWCT